MEIQKTKKTRPEFKEFDTFFKEEFVPRNDNLWSYKKYNTLNESEKTKITDKMAFKLLQQINAKYQQTDFKEIEVSKGNFYKFQGYKVIKDLTKILYQPILNSNNKDLIECLNIVDQSIKYLEFNAKIFEKGFFKKNFILITLYDSIAIGIINGLNLITTKTSFNKDNYGNLKVDVTSKNFKLVKNSTFKKLNEFNNLCVKNKFQNISTSLLKEDASLNEDWKDVVKTVIAGGTVAYAGSAAATAAGAGTGMGGAIGAAGTALATAATAVSPLALAVPVALILLPFLLFLIRRIVYKFFNLKINIRDNLSNLEDNLNLNLTVLNGNYEKNKDIIAKQEKWLKQVEKFKAKFEVEDKVAEKETDKDEIDLDEEISKETDTSSAPDDILI